MWQDVNIPGIEKIERLVAEFVIWELYISPYAKFRVKIYESRDDGFSGVANLQIKDSSGRFVAVTGYGKTIEETLQDTLSSFFEITAYKEIREFEESDFNCSEDF